MKKLSQLHFLFGLFLVSQVICMKHWSLLLKNLFAPAECFCLPLESLW